MPVIDEVVSKIEDWSGRDVSIEHLSGGLTNTNYKVHVDGQPFFIRVPGEGTELLAIDRKNEYHNSRAAAQACPACITPLVNKNGAHMSAVFTRRRGRDSNPR